ARGRRGRPAMRRLWPARPATRGRAPATGWRRTPRPARAKYRTSTVPMGMDVPIVGAELATPRLRARGPAVAEGDHRRAPAGQTRLAPVLAQQAVGVGRRRLVRALVGHTDEIRGVAAQPDQLPRHQPRATV